MNAANDRVDTLMARAGALGLSLQPATAGHVLAYLDAMLARNQQVNLTAIRSPADADVLHALDSLAIGLTGVTPQRALDLGSGNGFPGVAVAALWPSAAVDLLERTHKKARVLAELIEAVGLAHARVLEFDAAQAPALQPELRGHYDLITARAVAAPDAVARLAVPMLARDGRLVLWLDDAAQPPDRLASGLRLERNPRYVLPAPAARQRQLAVYRRRS